MLGTPTKVERGGRVFPESDKASDVTRALDRGMRDAGVTISLNTEVAHVRQADGGFNVELTQGGTLKAKSVIVATGRRELSDDGQHGRWLSIRKRKWSKRHETERVARGDDDG